MFYKCFEYSNVCSDWSSNTHKFHLFEQRVYIKINKFVQGFECFTQNKSESVRRFENIECFPLDLLSSNIRFVKKKKFWDSGKFGIRNQWDKAHWTAKAHSYSKQGKMHKILWPDIYNYSVFTYHSQVCHEVT